jgi:hypothetical protein
MTKYLYLSLIPEALIVSMLPPEEFGEYYTVGDKRKHSEQAIFIELDANFRHPFFRIDEAMERCVPHENGRPKKSVYVATYRVLEYIPLEVMGTLYLATRFGKVLPLEKRTDIPIQNQKFYLYQEIAPVSVLVASTFAPADFHFYMTHDPDNLISFPALAYVELKLDNLDLDPENAPADSLPYDFIPALREALAALRDKTIRTKMVDRTHSVEHPYRTIDTGIYIGNMDGLIYYPMLSAEELDRNHYEWWHSANS